MEHIWQIIVAVIGSTAVASLVQFFVNRSDNRKSLGKRLDRLERDGLRTQLLLLILMRPEEHQEILTIAEHYFRKPPNGLGGDWYMTSLFYKWLNDTGIAEPDWFDKGD